MKVNEILVGNNIDRLKELPDNSVHCVICSPPYFGLRSYLNNESLEKKLEIGLEDSLAGYIQKLVDVFEEVRRVLRNDGTFWLNLGDSYMSANCVPPEQTIRNGKPAMSLREIPGNRKPQPGLRQKSLMGVPWRVALALQDVGWYLRSDIIWAKSVSFNSKYSGTCMPESCKDRPTKSHEYLFLLTKSPKYFYDNLDSKEKMAPTSQERYKYPQMTGEKHETGGYSAKGATHTAGMKEYTGLRNLRSVWTINPRSYKGAHFATYPEALVEPCVKIGTSEKGCCANCGTPYSRILKKTSPDEEHKKSCGADSNGEYFGEATKNFEAAGAQNASEVKARILAGMKKIETAGWKKNCKCETNEIVPCIVLDPFSGSGTTLAVAKKLGRNWIGCELNPEYVKLAQERIGEILI